MQRQIQLATLQMVITIKFYMPCVDSLLENKTDKFMSIEAIIGLTNSKHLQKLSEYFDNTESNSTIKAE